MEGKETDPDGFFSVPVMKKGITEEGTEGDVVIGYEKTERPLGSGLSASGAVNCRCQLFPVQRQKTETVQVTTKPKPETPTSGTTGAKTPPRIIAGGRGSQLKAITDFEEKYKDLRTHEMGLITDYDGNILNEVKGEARQVSWSKGLSTEQLNELRKNGSFVLTHNHPSGLSLSYDDINTSISNNVAETRAVGSKYTYILQRPENGYPMRNKLKQDLIDAGEYTNDGDMGMYAYDKRFVQISWENNHENIWSEIKKFRSNPKENFSNDLHELYDKITTDSFEGLEEIDLDVSHIVNIRLSNKFGYNYQRITTKGG